MKDYPLNNIESLIIDVRDQKVILDSDVATIYGVETRAVNQAVQRNLDKFPKGYILSLSKKEWELMKSQIVISLPAIALPEGDTNPLKSHFATSKGGRTKLPKAFTEKGLYMLATILKSKQATQATLQIIETFAKVREFSRVAKSLAIEKNSDKKQALIKKSGELIADILNQEFAGDTSSETTIELNLAMIKIKHTIKRRK
ncbi:MAG: hypothetical protein B0D92_03400 [Spirochaeta sp. LUC14_002_19_P3]|nr:MAG: hypothetical protein B0D92_03400 [Spirochaeta sp. LUC14_002_19_P3]